MQQSTEYVPTTHTAIMIVGDPGTRKTSLAVHFPGCYLFDADNNLAGVVRRYPDVKFSYDNGHIVGEDWTASDRTAYKKGDRLEPKHRYQWMAKCLQAAAAHPDIKTTVIDSLTSLSDTVISEVKRQEMRKDEDPMRIQDYGKFAYLLRNLITQLKTVGKILILTSHQIVDKDDADGIYKTFIAVPGQSKTTLAGLFNDVWATYVTTSGAGTSMQHTYKVRTLPNGPNDHRGLKESLGLAQTFDWDQAKIIEKLQTVEK